MENSKFLKLEKNETVMLNLFAQDLSSALLAVRMSKVKGWDPEPIVCRVAVPPSETVATTPLWPRATITLGETAPPGIQQAKVKKNQVAPAPPPVYEVLSWQLLSLSEDLPKYDVTKKTKLDQHAIASPLEFLAEKCGYRWLPSHHSADNAGTTKSVRDFYNQYVEADKTDSQSQEVPGISALGMSALLQFRLSLTEKLFAQVAEHAKFHSIDVRRKQAANLSPPDKTQYIEAIKTLVANTPGSTEPTSDIDINTRGDGTEHAVAMFNKLFSLRYGTEPGIALDVNIYAKDFLPSFDGWPERKEKEQALIIRPCFDHEFSDYECEKIDARTQLKCAFTKLRRYMTEEQWKEFTKDEVFKNNDKLKTTLNVARGNHLKWAFWIAQTYAANVDPKDVKHPTEASELSGETFLADPRVDAAKLMEVQNRYYEYFLKDVEKKRDEFNLLQFSVTKDPNRHADELDKPYFELRSAMSKALYFANEAYVTAGAVLQTVGGKQKKSGGVKGGEKKHFHNIAYTAHELMASVVDQLADIHKESGRHFEEKGKEQDLGGALLACGKYIHRLLNALKQLYLLFKVAKVGNATEGFPKRLGLSELEWQKFRRLGIFLEALKKWKGKRERLVSLVERKLGTKELNSILLNKSKSSIAQEIAANKQFQFGVTPTHAASRDEGKNYDERSRGAPRKDLVRISPEDPASLTKFFARLVASIFMDYEEFLKISDNQLEDRFMNTKGPPFTLAQKLLQSDETPKDLDSIVGWLPPILEGEDAVGAEDDESSRLASIAEGAEDEEQS